MANIDLLDFDFTKSDTFKLSCGEISTSHNLKINEIYKFAKNLDNNDFLNQESASTAEKIFEVEYYTYQLIENNEKDGNLTFKFYSNEKVSIPKPITLVLGLPRPRMLRKILELAAVLPIREVIIVFSDLADKSYLLSHATTDLEIGQKIRIGVKQSGISFFPQVKFIKQNGLFFDKVLHSLAGYHVLGDSMHEFLNSSVASLLTKNDNLSYQNGIVLYVGPERGWSKRERALILDRGATSISLGAEIYQVDTAVVAICSQLKMIYDMNLEKEYS